MNMGLYRVKLINNFKTRFLAEVVDAGEIGQKIEFQLLFTKTARRCDLIERKLQRNFTSEFDLLENLELRFKLGNDFF
jgi:hypothetical protein